MNPVFYPGFGMEKYLADRLYALIYRMCQVQAFSSRLRARGFPAIGKYEPKTPPRTAGVTKYVIGFGRCSGFVRHFCREGPILRNPETGRASFPRSRTPQSRIGLADAPVSLPGRISGSVARSAVRPRTDTMPGEFVLSSSLSFFGACRNCNSPELSVRPDRKPSAADRSDVGSVRNADSCPVRQPSGPYRTASSEASYSVRTDTAIICFVMWRAYPPRSCDIS